MTKREVLTKQIEACNKQNQAYTDVYNRNVTRVNAKIAKINAQIAALPAE